MSSGTLVARNGWERVSPGYADLLAGYLIEAEAPTAGSRLRHEVTVRVLDPYGLSDEWWWFGLRSTFLNNWTPWIHSNLSRSRARPRG